MLDLERLKREAKDARDGHDRDRYWRAKDGKKIIMGLFTVELVEALISQAESRVDPWAPIP